VDSSASHSEASGRRAVSFAAVSPGKLAHSGSLAQLVEQRAFNPLVVGSSPTGPTPLRLPRPSRAVRADNPPAGSRSRTTA
jgi:hypothetical protein